MECALRLSRKYRVSVDKLLQDACLSVQWVVKVESAVDVARFRVGGRDNTRTGP